MLYCYIYITCLTVHTAGTLLQLRVKVAGVGGEEGAWRGVALLDLVLSPRYLHVFISTISMSTISISATLPSPSEPRAPGHVVLVAGGCRVPEFSHLVPRPPRAVPRPQLEAGTEAELRLQLEAVMLDVAR